VGANIFCEETEMIGATPEHFNRRWLAESARQGWPPEDVTLLFGSLDPGDAIVSLDSHAAAIMPTELGPADAPTRPWRTFWRTKPGQSVRKVAKPRFFW
jgi:hypothetical protein